MYLRIRASLSARPRLTDVVVACALAAALLPQSALTLGSLRVAPAWGTTVALAYSALHVSPALRRTAPLPAYALACLAMLVVVAAPNGVLGAQGPASSATGDPEGFPMLFLPSSLVFLPVLHGVAVHARRRLAVGALLAAVLGSCLALVRISETVPSNYPLVQYRSYVLLALLISVLSAWGLGIAHVTRERLHVAERAEATRAAILTERTRIARDMHDIVAHSLAVIVRQAEGGALIAPRSPERAAQTLQTIADTGREALRDMRGLLGVLREPRPEPVSGPDVPPGPTSPRASGDLDAATSRGAPEAPSARLEDLPPLLTRLARCGVTATLEVTGEPGSVSPTVELAAYHVVREALTNTVKHAGPRARAVVSLRWLPGLLEVCVNDDGGYRSSAARPEVRSGPGAASGEHGDAPEEPGTVPGAGVGLAGLRERVGAVGGTLTTPETDRGFVVCARLPRRDGRASS